MNKTITILTLCLLPFCNLSTHADPAPMDAYEKALLDEADTTQMENKPPPTQVNETEPTLPTNADLQHIAEEIAHSLEQQLTLTQDKDQLKQALGNVVSAALGQGLDLEAIQTTVKDAISEAQTQHSDLPPNSISAANEALEEVITANRRLIEGEEDKQLIETTPAIEQSRQQTTGEQFSEKHTHIVKKGESLSILAKNYYKDGLKYWKIYQANQKLLSDPNLVLVGQVLTIPE